MSINTLIDKIKTQPESVEFDEIIQCIDQHYHFTATAFHNGETENVAGSNIGSCKILSFARRHQLNQADTLACFGKYYRDDVLKHPEGEDHANIRNFMKNGWEGVRFETEALCPKEG